MEIDVGDPARDAPLLCELVAHGRQDDPRGKHSSESPANRYLSVRRRIRLPIPGRASVAATGASDADAGAEQGSALSRRAPSGPEQR